MSLYISFEGSMGVEAPADLQALADGLVNERLDVTPTTVKVPGAKADLMVGLTVASFAVTSVGTLFQVITFWQDQRKRYRLTLEAAGKSISTTDPTAAEFVQSAVSANQPVRILVEQA